VTPLDPRIRRDEAVAALKRAFAAAGLDSPGADARLIAAHALGVQPLDLTLRADEPLGAEAASRLEALARRRLAREPVDRILGVREFWGLPFRLSRDTLSPRPDTETLVAAALRHAPDARRILDLGTGSGCILTALLHERPGAWGLGTDRSPGALAAARENARLNGVGARAAFAAGDWGAALAGPFDLVVSNPPYIASGVVPTLDEEVRRHDPAAALDGGEDGLDAYRAILADAPHLLGEGGILALEIGYDQEEALRALAAAGGFEVAEVARDLAGHPRAVVLRAAPSGPGPYPSP
jgi:release factor glutamine methyltransferase